STEEGGAPTSFFGMDEVDGGCTIMTTADGQDMQHHQQYYPTAQIIPRKPRPSQDPTITVVPKKEEMKEEEGTSDDTATSSEGHASAEPPVDDVNGVDSKSSEKPMYVQTARSTDYFCYFMKKKTQ
uniref:Uncharacterized protein n=1 Tax=Caenorhabditis japonica TaxID=281687 RepID=A0A8R1E5V2_CAEJA